MLAICWPLVLSGLLAVKPLLLSSYGALFRYIVATIYSILVVVSLVASHSRMGLVGAYFGLVVWGVFYIRSRPHGSEMSKRWMPWALGLLSFIFAIWFGVAFSYAKHPNTHPLIPLAHSFCLGC